MVHLIRFFFVGLVTYIITIFVVDFQSVVDGFDSMVTGISNVLSPIKGAFK